MLCSHNLEKSVLFGIRALLNMNYYAVAKGRNPGIYQSWAECEAQVKGFKQSVFKKFPSKELAKQFIFGAINIATPSGPSFLTKDQSKPLNEAPKRSFASSSRSKDTPKNERAVFEDIHEIQDEIISKMEEIEKQVAVIESSALKRTANKPKVEKKAVKRKAIMIDTQIPTKKTLESSSNSHLYESKSSTDSLNGKERDFTIDDSGFVEVYTDGSCTNNGYSTAKAGLGVCFGEGHRLNVSEPVSGRATNNCGEIQAATKAIRVAHSNGIKKLRIKTDSHFVINAMTKWISGWKRKGWKLASGQPVKNEVDFKDLDAASKLIEVDFVYVAAHKGILGNEIADQLAKSGAAMYQRTKT